MEPYSRILEAIERSGDPASALTEIEQEISEIPQKLEVLTAELASLREEENSYNTYLPNFQAALSTAQRELSVLSKNDINEIRSFAKPPKTVEKVAEGILILLGSSNISWDAFRKLSGNQFLETLVTFDIHNVPKQRIDHLKPFIDEYEGHEVEIRKVSKATYGLYMWVAGVYKFCQLLSQFRPIGQIRAEINEKNQEIAGLQQKLDEGPSKIEALKERIEKMNNP
ncbi:unnamed protein product [Blepharisma stoltei]|uniref:Dynein heavy chain coiled coil stalk domain-containing protein n=1 Tax=Blepharisma stoltei TaxID=1481888 RepID=A0AAU9JWD7_9CILI|nr:unnamed protein product [Blepharisma stoltei]